MKSVLRLCSGPLPRCPAAPGMMADVQPFYVPDGPATFASTPSTAGPWGPDSQHGGPPAALLTRAVERLDRDGAERVVGRFTMELLGPVPVGPLRVEASVVRPGRTVEMCEATAYDVRRDRPVARATAWLFPAHHDGPAQDGRAARALPRRRRAQAGARVVVRRLPRRRRLALDQRRRHRARAGRGVDAPAGRAGRGRADGPGAAADDLRGLGLRRLGGAGPRRVGVPEHRADRARAAAARRGVGLPRGRDHARGRQRRRRHLPGVRRARASSRGRRRRCWSCAAEGVRRSRWRRSS